MAELRQNIDPTLTDSRQIVAGDNRVGNSDFAINRFTTGSVVVAAGQDTLVCDDWRLNNNNTTVSYTGSVINYGSVVGVPRRALRSTCTASGSIGATVSSGLRTPISTFDLEDLFLGSSKQQPFFITFLVRSNKTGSNTVALLGSGVAPTEVAYPTTFNTVANTWVQATLGPFSNVNTGTFTGLNNTNFLELWFALAAGTSVRSWTPSVVQTGSNRAVTGSLSYDTSGDFIEIGEVQLIRGSIPRTWAANANYPSRFPSSGGIADTNQVVAGKNRVINSGFTVNQFVSTTQVIPASSSRNVVDMWKGVNGSSAGTLTTVLNTNTFSSITPKRSIRATVNSNAVLATNVDISLLTVIPPSDFDDLDLGTAGAKPFYIAFKVRSNKTGNNTVTLLGSGAGASTVSYPVSYPTVANTWSQVVIPVSNLTSASWVGTGFGPNLLFYLVFPLAAGTGSISATGGQVNIAETRMITGSLQYGTAGDFLEIGEVQIINGSTPRVWEAQKFADELYQCQRFYQKSYPYATTIGTIGSAGYTRLNLSSIVANTAGITLNIKLPVLTYSSAMYRAYNWNTGTIDSMFNLVSGSSSTSINYGNPSNNGVDFNGTWGVAQTGIDVITQWTAEVAY
jgi:hypothetical protein